MRYRNLLLVAVLASGLAGAATVAVDNGIAVKESDVATPARGMTMEQVASKFGAPVTKVPSVGKPPISRWEYPGFVVYFEADHVIHSVVAAASSDAAPAPANDAAPAN
jgi:outer membrane protein assembly factor BamE (lipoprotein component of BamABCDE complex)